MSTRSSTSDADHSHMARALALALRGVALAHPNPVVGAVLVKGNRVIGEGFHAYDKRVVAAIQDPNPAVAGKGLTTLRRAGIQVTTGVCEEEARRWNDDFAKWSRTGLPLV